MGDAGSLVILSGMLLELAEIKRGLGTEWGTGTQLWVEDRGGSIATVQLSLRLECAHVYACM